MFISSMLVLAAFLPMDIQTTAPAYHQLQQVQPITITEVKAPDNLPIDTKNIAANLKRTCQDNSACAATEFCQKENGKCSATGVCESKPEFCTMDYTPVCGCDKQTYGNACAAHSAGINIDYQGECQKLALPENISEVIKKPELQIEPLKPVEETPIDKSLVEQIELEDLSAPIKDLVVESEQIDPPFLQATYNDLGKISSYLTETDDGKNFFHELQYNVLGQLDVEIITDQTSGEQTKLEGLGDRISQLKLRSDQDSALYDVTMIEKNGFGQLEFSTEDEEKVILPIEGLVFQEKEEELGVSLNDNYYKLKFSPPDFYRELKRQADDENFLIKNIKLVEKDGKPAYEVIQEVDGKLFGIIPIKLDPKLVIAADTNELVFVEYGFLGKLSVKPGWHNFEIKEGPNLVVSNLRFDKNSYSAGHEMKVTFTVTNNGNKLSSVGVHEDGKSGSIELRFADEFLIDSQNNLNFILSPGKSYDYSLKWSAIICNAPVSILVDSTNRIDELNEDDNILYFTTRCAPSNAPDLRAEIMNNNIRIIGEVYKVNYRIYNDGTVDAPPSMAILMTGEDFLTNRFIPEIKAGKYYAASVTVTPRKCDRFSMIADYGDIINETDENNNVGYENPDISSGCFKRPDLTVSHVWWIAGGYSFGEPSPGEQVWLEYTIKNNSKTNDQGGCVGAFKVDVYSGDKWIARRHLGRIGCWEKYSHSHPDYFIRRDQISWPFECGVPLTITVDPLNEISEQLENNNTWTKTFPCTLAPPIATPA